MAVDVLEKYDVRLKYAKGLNISDKVLTGVVVPRGKIWPLDEEVAEATAPNFWKKL